MKSSSFKFNQDYYITIIDTDGIPIMYSSGNFKIMELEFLKLIRVFYKEGRNKKIGKNFLTIYKETAKDSIEKLKLIGINENETKKSRKYQRR